MRARASFLVMALLASHALLAQTVEQGKKFFYYERFRSAKDAFEKALADKPGNQEAAYWLGQTLIELKDVNGAKEVYRKGLEANGNAPLLLVGMGHIELLENKAADARQRFDLAINATKSKNIDVLSAVGKANAEAPSGDAAYAIEKLNLATTIKGFKDPEVFINMGNAYRKIADGGGAVTAYSRAFTTDPKYAASKYYTGKVYQSQKNREIYLPAFEESVQVDPAFAPGYRELYFDYYNRDVNKAIEYLDKYAANTDQTPELEYERTSVFFAARKYQEAIDKAKSTLAAQGAAANPKYHRLIAYSYEALGDSVQALAKIQEFLKVAPADMVLPGDYELQGNLLLKFPDRITEAMASLDKAVEMDTSFATKQETADKLATLLDKKGMLKEAAAWKGKAYRFNRNPTKQDLFYTGYAFVKAQEYDSARVMFGSYATQYPDETYGHYWLGRIELIQDTTGENGKPLPHFTKFIEVAEKDVANNKNTLITAYGYMAAYNANVLKDKEAAIGYFDKILGVDPNNADAKRLKEVLQKQLSAPKTQTKPATGK